MIPHPRSVRRTLLYLVLTASLPFVLAILLAVAVLGVRSWRDSVSALEARTEVLQGAIETTLREAIVAYLRAKTETAISIVTTLDETARSAGAEEARFDHVRNHLLSLSVVRSGYVYVVDDTGNAVIHPDPETQGRVLSGVEPVRTQLAEREGYLEYIWQNSFEPLPLPKALYMAEYPPRDWIVASTAYRQEFVGLVDAERLADLVSGIPVGKGSYSVVVSREGAFVAHPDFPGRRLAEFFDPAEEARIMAILFGEPAGTLRYSWPDLASGERSEKLLVFRYMPDFDWTIATTLDIRQIRRPVVVYSVLSVALAFVFVVLVINTSLRVAHTVSDPIIRLAEAAESGRATASTSEFGSVPRELALLTGRFNTLMARIEEQQAVLQRSVCEKTVLIREIHHRVKNNLQVIASLLNLQAADAADPADAALFQRSCDRVISIAMVHEQLYQTENLSMIPFDLYLEDLLSHIGNTNHVDGIVTRLDVESIALGIDRAVPCGLIVNELVTNAYKHAFPAAARGSIGVSFRRNGEHYMLEVEDTGAGIAPELEKSLGMTLVYTLVEQVGGTITVTGDNGTTVRIVFPVERNVVRSGQS
jgi:two-component sensor histidine kinase